MGGAIHHLRPLVGIVALDRPESAMEALLEADRDLVAQAVRADDETGERLTAAAFRAMISESTRLPRRGILSFSINLRF